MSAPNDNAVGLRQALYGRYGRAVALAWNGDTAGAEALLGPDAPRLPRAALHYAETRLTTTWMTGSRIKGAWRLRKAWNVYAELMRQVDGSASAAAAAVRHEVMFGVGSFLFLLSWLPPVVLRLLEMVGFEGNRSLGLRYHKEVFADAAGVRAPLSALMLLLNLLVLPRALADVGALLAEAEGVVRVCLERWPSGSLFHWMASFLARKRGDNDGAIAHVDRALELAGGTGNAFRFDRAALLFAGARWDEAAESLAAMARDAKSEQHVDALLLLAACHEMSGRQREAAECLARVPSSAPTAKQQDLADLAKLCRKRATGTAFAPFELLYLRRDVAHMAPDRAAALLEALERKWAVSCGQAGKEEATVVYLVRGALLCAAGQRDEGLAELRRAAQQSRANKHERHVAPFAEFDLAEIAYRAGDRPQAEELLQACGARTGYVFEDFLKTRVRLGLEQIREETSTAARS
eukprot:m51a1_g4843 hypothetical protein (465) ;mRNA; r:229075-231019